MMPPKISRIISISLLLLMSAITNNLLGNGSTFPNVAANTNSVESTDCETVTINIGGWDFSYTLGVGDGCDDGNPMTINDTYDEECRCVGECIDDDQCCDFRAEVHSLACSPEADNPNGNVAIQVTGGTPFPPPSDPYQTYDGNHVGGGLYEEDGLDPGTYTYTYWDMNGCEISVTFTISADECCDFKAEVHSLACSQEADNPNGNVAIQVTGGTPFPPPSDPYQTYDGNHVGGGLYEDDGLDPGTYTYTYRDANGCETEVTFTISGDPCCEFKAEVLSSSCSQVGNPNAHVTIQVSGGTQFSPPSDPYQTYDGNHVGGGIYEDDDLDPGTYTYTYRDANGCEADVTFTIFEGPDASIHSIGGCSQIGNSNGNIAIQVTGGTPFPAPSDPYQSYDGNYVGNGIYEDDGLDPGTYTYTYTDMNGCSDNVIFTIAEPLVAEITSASDCGKVTVELSGGTPTYTSNYDGQQNSTGIFEFFLTPDDYELSFTDENGCVVSVFVSLDEPDLAMCEDFTFSKSKRSWGWIPGSSGSSSWNSDVFVSGERALIGVHINAISVHDVLRVNKNGVEILNLEAGSNSCGPANDCMGDNQSNCAAFIVDCCDEITFHVDGAVCPSGNTVWHLNVTCLEVLDDCFRPDYKPNTNDNLNKASTETVSMEAFVSNSLQSYDKNLLVPDEIPQSDIVEIFPNPTSDKFHIYASKLEYELQTVRIMDVSGHVIKVENILGLNNPIVDSSSLIEGIYLVEIVDTMGNVFIEKLVKN